jgi:hypothetical protein
MFLCKPALVYLIFSIIGTFMMLIQNIGTNNLFCLGSFSCIVPNVTMVFSVNIIYILFWTFILNLICNSGYIKLAWFLVLIPFILSFILLMIMIGFINKESFFK